MELLNHLSTQTHEEILYRICGKSPQEDEKRTQHSKAVQHSRGDEEVLEHPARSYFTTHGSILSDRDKRSTRGRSLLDSGIQLPAPTALPYSNRLCGCDEAILADGTGDY